MPQLGPTRHLTSPRAGSPLEVRLAGIPTRAGEVNQSSGGRPSIPTPTSEQPDWIRTIAGMKALVLRLTALPTPVSHMLQEERVVADSVEPVTLREQPAGTPGPDRRTRFQGADARTGHRHRETHPRSA